MNIKELIEELQRHAVVVGDHASVLLEDGAGEQGDLNGAEIRAGKLILQTTDILADVD